MLSARNLPRSALRRIRRCRRPSPPPLPRPPTQPPPQPLPPRPMPQFDPLLSRDLEHLGTNRTRVPPPHATSNVKSRFGIGTKHISELPEVNLARNRSRMDTIGTCDAFCRLQMCGGKRETTVSPSEPLFFPRLSRSRSGFRFFGLSRALFVFCLCLISPPPLPPFPSPSFTDTVSTQTAFPNRGKSYLRHESMLNIRRSERQHAAACPACRLGRARAQGARGHEGRFVRVRANARRRRRRKRFGRVAGRRQPRTALAGKPARGDPGRRGPSAGVTLHTCAQRRAHSGARMCAQRRAHVRTAGTRARRHTLTRSLRHLSIDPEGRPNNSLASRLPYLSSRARVPSIDPEGGPMRGPQVGAPRGGSRRRALVN